MDLKRRVDQLNDTLTSYLESERTCLILNLNIELLIRLLEANNAKNWGNAVNNGSLECSYVPGTVCDDLENCAMVDGVCGGIVPTQAPTSCMGEMSDWEDAVNDGGLACSFVPDRVCDLLSNCTMYNGTCTEKNQPCSAEIHCNSAGTTSDNFSPDGCICECFEFAEGDNCETRATATVNANINANTISMPTMLIVTTLVEAPYENDVIHFMIVNAGDTYSALDVFEADARCYHTIPQTSIIQMSTLSCEMVGGESLIGVFVIMPPGGDPYISTETPFDTNIPEVVDLTVGSSTKDSVTVTIDLDNYNPDEQITLAIDGGCIEVLNQNTNDPITVTINCEGLGFNIAHELTAVVTGRDAVSVTFVTENTSFIPSLSPTTSTPSTKPTISEPTFSPTDAIVFTGEYQTLFDNSLPLVFQYTFQEGYSETGSIYWMICNQGVSPSIQDVLAGSCDCSGNAPQEPSGTIQSTCHLNGGHQYELFAVADRDSEGGFPDEMQNSPLVIDIPPPGGVFHHENTSILNGTYLETSLFVTNPSLVGRYYYAICLNGEDPTAEELLDGACYTDCSGSDLQIIGEKFFIQPCLLTPGTTGTLKMAVDIDGQGSGAVFLLGIPADDTSFTIPGTPVSYEVTMTIMEIRDCDSTGVQLAEWMVYGNSDTESDKLLTMDSYTSTPATQNLDNLFDRDISTKWSESTIQICSNHLSIKSGVIPDVRPTYFTFTLADDFPEKDPTKFTIEVCETISNTCETYLYEINDPDARNAVTAPTNLIGEPLQVVATGVAAPVVLVNTVTGEEISIDLDGAYAFSYWTQDSGAYDVQVSSADPTSICEVINGSGTVALGSSVDISISCQPRNTFTPTFTFSYADPSCAVPLIDLSGGNLGEPIGFGVCTENLNGIPSYFECLEPDVMSETWYADADCTVPISSHVTTNGACELNQNWGTYSVVEWSGYCRDEVPTSTPTATVPSLTPTSAPAPVWDCRQPDGTAFRIGEDRSCWDWRFTCESCCYRNVDITPRERSCWTPDTWLKEDCCGLPCNGETPCDWTEPV